VIKAVEVFSVSRKTLYNWLSLKSKGDYRYRPKSKKGKPYKLNNDQLRSYIKDHPDAYLQEIGDHFGVSGTAVLYACRKLGITRKKKSLIQRTRFSTKKKV